MTKEHAVFIPRVFLSGFLKLMLSLPVLWISMDVLEKIIIYRLLSGFPQRDQFLARILGFVEVIKFGFLLLSVLIPSVLLTVTRKRPEKNI